MKLASYWYWLETRTCPSHPPQFAASTCVARFALTPYVASHAIPPVSSGQYPKQCFLRKVAGEFLAMCFRRRDQSESFWYGHSHMIRWLLINKTKLLICAWPVTNSGCRMPQNVIPYTCSCSETARRPLPLASVFR